MSGIKIETQTRRVESDPRGLEPRPEDSNEDLRRANDEVARLTAQAKEREATLARVEAVAHVGSWRLDLATQARRWSDETYRIFGIEKGEPLTSESVFARIRPEDRALAEGASRASVQGDAIDVQYRVLVGGETRWVRARSEPVEEGQRDRVGTVQDITDLKRVEEELRQSEQRLRELFESAPDGIFIAGADGRYTDVNRAGCRMLGYAREELLGRSVTEFVAPGDLPRQTTLTRYIQQGGVEVSEWRLRRKDGSYVPVEMSADALPDGRLRAFVRDITERREAQEQLSLSEAKFSGIVSISADAILLVDEAQRITFFNEGAEKTFGYAREEVLGEPLDILIPERLRGAHRAHVQGFAAGGAAARRMGERGGVIVGRRKNGEEFPADAAISKLDLGGRRILTVALRDVTEQKRVEREERFFSEVGAVLAATLDFDAMATSIARLTLQLADWCVLHAVYEDGGARRVFVSSADPAKQSLAAALQRLSHDRERPHMGAEEMVSKAPRVFATISPEILDAMIQDVELRALVEALGITSLMAVPLVAHDRALGVLVAVSSTAQREFGPFDLRLLEGLGQRAALSLENARLYRARQQAIEARDGVLGVVAHDLRNPLNNILLLTKIAQRRERKAPSPPGENLFEEVTRSANQMNRLIQDLLDVASVDNHAMSLDCQAVTPSELIAEVTDAQRLLAAEAGLELQMDVAPDLPRVWADAERLLRVFGNLVGNALKFTPRGGRVTLGASKQGDCVLFRVGDTGPGIPESHLPHLFDRFWQGKRTDRRGAGLGLSIAQGIVEAHGGHIAVESTAGQGTTFRFTVPVASRPG